MSALEEPDETFHTVGVARNRQLCQRTREHEDTARLVVFVIKVRDAFLPST